MVLLICQIKVNSIAIVNMKSMDGGKALTKGFSGFSGDAMCSVEQVTSPYKSCLIFVANHGVFIGVHYLG